MNGRSCNFTQGTWEGETRTGDNLEYQPYNAPLTVMPDKSSGYCCCVDKPASQKISKSK